MVKKPVNSATLNNFFWEKRRYNWRQYGVPDPVSDEPLMALAYDRFLSQRKSVIVKRRRGRTKASQKWATLVKPTKIADCYKTEYLRNNRQFDGHECLIFPSMVPGRPEGVRYNFTKMAAARAMLLMTAGRPPDGKEMALHKCGNGHLSCVNPKHLYWGDAVDNARDMVVHKSPSQFMAGMTKEEVESIRNDERLSRVIAFETNVPPAVVVMIKNGEIFKDNS